MPTAIQWCDETFNPWWGCEKVSPGCAHCYAEGISNHRAGRGNWGAGHSFRFFGDSHWAEPLKWARNLPTKLGRRPRIFCASMADVFEERRELDEHRARLFDLIEQTPDLDWLVLTKRPEFARDWLDEWHPCDGCAIFPRPLPNVWLGVSIENARHTWRADVLREIPAAVRFISAEPLLESLFIDHRRARVGNLIRKPLDLTGIDWVIIGGESGPKARPFHLEHARELIDDCLDGSGGIAIFVKQLGAKPIGDVPLKLRDRKGGQMDEWPADLQFREFPTAVPA